MALNSSHFRSCYLIGPKTATKCHRQFSLLLVLQKTTQNTFHFYDILTQTHKLRKHFYGTLYQIFIKEE